MPRPEELLEMHISLQLGCYFDQVATLRSSTRYASSRRISDACWNFGYRLPPDRSYLATACAEIRRHAREIDRPAVVYWIPDDARSRALEEVPTCSSHEELWMLLADGDLAAPSATDLVIEPSTATTPGEPFLSVFEDAFTGSAPHPAAPAARPVEHLEALRRSRPGPGVRVAHLTGSVDGKAVTIASVYCSPPWAGLYNVGTVHAARRRGFGKSLCAAAARLALDNDCRHVFLQTTADGPAARLYSRLGFRPAFRGRFLELSAEAAEPPGYR